MKDGTKSAEVKKAIAKKLTAAQQYVMKRAHQGLDLYEDCKQFSDHGGRRQTLNALRKMGLLWSDGTLTEQGKEKMMGGEKAKMAT